MTVCDATAESYGSSSPSSRTSRAARRAAPRCYTSVMPTHRPRVTITETPIVARRLDLVASRHPELAGSRREQLLLLTELGERVLRESGSPSDDRAAARRRLLERTRALTSTDANTILAGRESDWARDRDD